MKRKSWKELTGVKKLADERKWTYPVPVIQPHIRSIAVDPRNSRRLCIAAQVGGVLLSEDEGATWRDVRYPIDLDVHSVTFDFGRPNILYAATGRQPRGLPIHATTKRKTPLSFDRQRSIVGIYLGDVSSNVSVLFACIRQIRGRSTSASPKGPRRCGLSGPLKRTAQ